MLKLAFFLSTIALFLQSVLSPPFSLLVYAPWIALVVLRTQSPKCLYLSLIGGIMVDLLSDDPMGVHALNYTIVALFLFRFRKFFLYDNPLHLSLFTILVSFSSTLLQLFLLFLFDRRIPFTGQWAFGDLLAMPIADAIYALVWFALPLTLYKRGRIYWLKVKKRFFPTSP